MKKIIKWGVFALVWLISIFYVYLPYLGTMVDRTWYVNCVCVDILCLCIFLDAVSKGRFLNSARNFWLEK